MSAPNVAIAGINTNHPRRPPASIYEAIFGPHIYPTPISAGYTSAESSVLRDLIFAVITPGITFIPSTRNLKSPARPIPINTDFALVPPSSPARSTSAHAVPSG